MAKEFDITTLNLSAGTHEIYAKARASGHEDSEPSNSVFYMVVPQENPDTPQEPETYSMSLECFVTYYEEYNPINLESFTNSYVDEDGNLHLLYGDYNPPFSISIPNVDDISKVLGGMISDRYINLKSGQKITFYPFDSELGGFDDNARQEKFRFIIRENASFYVRYNGTQYSYVSKYDYDPPHAVTMLYNEDNGDFWGQIRVDPEFNETTGQGFTRILGGTEENSVDFSQGVTIDVE